MSRLLPLALPLALLVYAALRAAVLTWSFDGVAIPNYELFMGNIAVVGREGWFGPPLHQYYDNCGGHLATGLLAMPLFELFGETYLSLKLVPLLLGAAALVLVHALLRRHLGPLAALIGALAFAIGPPTLAKYSLLAKGNHFENLAFQLLMVWSFYRLHTCEPARRRAWLVAFAASAGFAVFFYFGSLAMLALLCLVHLLVRGPRGTARDLLPSVPALLLGLAPLIWVYVSASARPGSFLDAKLGGGSERSLEVARERMEALWTDLLPRAGCFEDLGSLPAATGEWLYLGAFALAWLSLLPTALAGVGRCLWRRAEGEEAERQRFQGLLCLPFVAYLPFFSLLFSASSFDFDAYAPPVEIGQFRYLVPHFAFATVLFGIAIGCHGTSERKARRTLAAVIALPLAASQLFTLPIISEPLSVPGVATRYAGYDFVFENNVLLRDVTVDPVTGVRTWDMEQMRADLEEFPTRHRGRTLLGLGYYLAWGQIMPGSPKASAPRPPGIALGELLEPFPADLHPDLARGVGAFLRVPAGHPGGARGKLETFGPALVAEAHPLLPYVFQGLSCVADYPLARNTADILRQSAALRGLTPPDLRGHHDRGYGRLLGELVARGIPADLELVEQSLEAFRPTKVEELWFGYGSGLARTEGVLPCGLARVPGPQRATALRGMGAGLRSSLGLEGARPVFDELGKQLSAEERTALELGLRWPGYPAPYEL